MAIRSAILSVGATCLLLGTSVHGAFAQNDNHDIIIAAPFAFDNIDSCNSSSEVGLVVRENVVEALTHLNPVTGEPEPRLATSWEQTGSTELAPENRTVG